MLSNLFNIIIKALSHFKYLHKKKMDIIIQPNELFELGLMITHNTLHVVHCQLILIVLLIYKKTKKKHTCWLTFCLQC